MNKTLLALVVGLVGLNVSNAAQAAVPADMFKTELLLRVEALVNAQSDSFVIPSVDRLVADIRGVEAKHDYKVCTRGGLLGLFTPKSTRIRACIAVGQEISQVASDDPEAKSVNERIQSAKQDLDDYVTQLQGDREHPERAVFASTVSKELDFVFTTSNQALEKLAQEQNDRVRGQCNLPSLRKSVECAMDQTIRFLQGDFRDQAEQSKLVYDAGSVVVETEVEAYTE